MRVSVTVSIAALLGAWAPGILPSNGMAATAPDDSVLAVFEGGTVYPSEFARSWGILDPPSRPPGTPVQSRIEWLGRIVDRKLLAKEALSRPFTMTHEETLSYLRARDAYLQNELFQHILAEAPPAAPQDLDLFRRQNRELAEIRFIMFPDFASARSWRLRLNAGTPIAALDQAIAKGGSTAPKADSTRFVAAETIPDTLARIIWRMRPGQLSEILDLADHPTAIHVLRFEHRISPVNTDDPAAVAEAFNAKRITYVRESYREQLKRELVVRYEDDAMELLLARHRALPRRSGVDSLSGLPTMRATLPVPRVDPADTSRVLAILQGRPLSIGTYLAFWTRQSALARPEVLDRPALEAAVDRVLFGPELVRRAQRMGLANDSSVVASLGQIREGIALDHYYSEVIQSRIPMDESRIRAYYDKSRERYDDRPTVDAHILMVNRKSEADSLLARMRAGEKFEDLARLYSMHGESAVNGGNMGQVVRGTNPNAGLEDAMFATPVGQIGGPEQTPDGFVLWRIDRASPALKRTYELARDWVVRDYRTAESERILKEQLVELRRQANVRVFDERVTATLGN